VFRVLRECWRRVVDALWHGYLKPRIGEKLFCSLHALLLFYRRYKPQEIRPKTLLLTRVDGFGDYCLFRNFLKPLRESYPDYEITFLCRRDLLEVIEGCGDRVYVDKVLAVVDISKWSLLRHPLLYIKTLCLLAQESYEIAIFPVYSRLSSVDRIARWINASIKIGSIGQRIKEDWYQNVSIEDKDRAYTTLLDATSETIFEFNRNREFFSQLLKKPLTDIKYHLDLPPLPKDSSLPLSLKPYGVFFLGASFPRKKWSLQSWVELALKISPDFQIVLCGSKKEIDEAQKIMLGFPKALNLVGQTTFIELLHILFQSSFIVSLETAIPHFAVALGLGPIFVICNGNALGRFVPYPEDIQANYHVIYHPKVEALLATPTALVAVWKFMDVIDWI
uniref:glycosyltransferase family 9 protein n=1 Tax=Helicobacter suis TaxID=104628 RepID=UPI0013D3043F